MQGKIIMNEEFKALHAIEGKAESDTAYKAWLLAQYKNTKFKIVEGISLDYILKGRRVTYTSSKAWVLGAFAAHRAREDRQSHAMAWNVSHIKTGVNIGTRGFTSLKQAKLYAIILRLTWSIDDDKRPLLDNLSRHKSMVTGLRIMDIHKCNMSYGLLASPFYYSRTNN